MPANAELGLFRTEAARYVPRDNRGRFVAVSCSGSRRVVLERCRQMRVQLGIDPHPLFEALLPDEGKPA